MGERRRLIPLADLLRPLPASAELRAVRRDRRQMLRRALRGRCPLCGTPGIRRGWARIHDRCRGCNFRFSRERGYLSGAAWLNLSGALATLIVVLVGGAALTAPDTNWPLLAGLTTVAVVATAIVLQPPAVALFLWVDLAYFRPLDAGDLAQNDPLAEVDRTGRPI